MPAVVAKRNALRLTMEFEQEEDGRWIAEVPELPGVLAYGASIHEAGTKAEAIALRVIADKVEEGALVASELSFTIMPPRA